MLKVNFQLLMLLSSEKADHFEGGAGSQKIDAKLLAATNEFVGFTATYAVLETTLLSHANASVRKFKSENGLWKTSNRICELISTQLACFRRSRCVWRARGRQHRRRSR
jgi:hypothetical protein